MTIREYYNSFSATLQVIYSRNEAEIISDWVFETIAFINHSDLLKNAEQELNNKTTDQLNKALQEWLQHKPVQYVLGEAWF